MPASQQSSGARDLQDQYRHDLEASWGVYGPSITPADLSRFDEVIADLDRWEKLRYGGFPSGVPITMIFDRSTTGEQRKSNGTGPQDVYVFAVQDVDDLYAAMISAGNIPRLWDFVTRPSRRYVTGMSRRTSTSSGTSSAEYGSGPGPVLST